MILDPSYSTNINDIETSSSDVKFCCKKEDELLNDAEVYAEESTNNEVICSIFSLVFLCYNNSLSIQFVPNFSLKNHLKMY